MFQRLFKDLHWPLIFPTFALSVLGTLFIYSAAYHDSGAYETKQIFWLLVGFAVFFMAAFTSYRIFLSMAYLFYAAAILSLIWVLIGGQTRLGAQRWISLGPIIFQPSEFAKLATILMLADYLGTHPEFEREKKVLPIGLAICLLPLVLIMKQPDLGSSLLFVPLMVIMFFLWGIRYRYLIGAGLVGVIGAPLLWSILKEYQKKRILVFLDPSRDPLGAGYTAIQSKIAVGSGQFWGKGFLEGTQSQLQFVPEHHTDFIFCVIGEEWGFMGAILLVILYTFLFVGAFKVFDSTTDMKAKLLTSGIVAVLFAQVFINLGMTIGLMPITGVTLPLVSYGGSSFVMTCFSLGLLASIYRERSIF